MLKKEQKLRFCLKVVIYTILLLFLVFMSLACDSLLPSREDNPTPSENAGSESPKQWSYAAPTPELKLSANSVQPGDFLVLFLDNLFIEYNDDIFVNSPLINSKLTFFPLNTGRAAFLPVNYRTKPGEYELKVTIIREGLSLLEEVRTLTVEPKEFQTQYLRVTPSQEAKRSSDLLEKDAQHTDKARSYTNPTPLWQGAFLQPVEGRISTEFGLTRFINNVESGRHAGIDIAAPKGTPVKASNSGRVNLARSLYVTGNTIILDHGMYLYTSYAHLNRMLVKDGDWVKKGDIIGEIGTTGFSTGPHLHWTVCIGQTFVNPWLFLADNPLGRFTAESDS